MEEHNAIQSSTPFFFAREPAQQRSARNTEIAETLDQLPVIKTAVEHLNDRINATDSIKQAFVVAKEYGITTEEALVVLDIVNKQLASEVSQLMTKVEKVAKA